MEALGTQRLTVRPWTEGDAEAFHAIWSDPEVIFWGPTADRDESRARLRAVIQRCAGHPWPVAWHAVVEQDTGEVVGDVILQPAPFAAGEWEVGWHLRRDRWGRGYATEAAAALVEEAFRRLAPARIVCAILPDNVRSIATARRLGFERVGPVMHARLWHDLYARGP
jgi:RimJ/RimL family protein N-acetyltransferase